MNSGKVAIAMPAQQTDKPMVPFSNLFLPLISHEKKKKRTFVPCYEGYGGACSIYI